MNFGFARKHIEKLYSDKCSVFERQDVEVNNITEQQDVEVYTNLPCHISHNKSTPTVQAGIPFNPNLVSTLSLSPEHVIKAGSKIIVTRAGQSTAYRNSGTPRVYTSHQEIDLELDDDRS